jgi:hypothetical protein
MTREEMNYRMPDKCCLVCDSSYFNTYGDTCCEHMGHANTIETGGVCDLFNRTYDDNDIAFLVSLDSVHGEETKEVNENKDRELRICRNCKHSYFDGSLHRPTCDIDRSHIVDECDFCPAWDEDYA